jgi:hypothetical protein
MNPVKFKELIDETAQRLELPPQVVTVVLQLYFKDLRAAITGLSHPRVQVLNLGTFQLKPLAIRKKLFSKQQRAQEHACEETAGEIMDIEKVLALLETEKQRKHQFKQKRQSHEPQDQPDRTLEKEG